MVVVEGSSAVNCVEGCAAEPVVLVATLLSAPMRRLVVAGSWEVGGRANEALEVGMVAVMQCRRSKTTTTARLNVSSRRTITPQAEENQRRRVQTAPVSLDTLSRRARSDEWRCRRRAVGRPPRRE